MKNSRQDYDIVGSYDNQRYSPVNAERTINMFEYIDPNGKRPKSLFSTSGLLDSGLEFTSATGGSRGTFVFKDSAGEAIYQVFDEHIYRINGESGDLSVTPVGSLETATGYVGIEANQFQVIFVDGSKGYIYDVNANTFKQITDDGFPSNPIDVTFLDGFFIVAEGGTNHFHLSALNQGMVWSQGTATFTANATTDLLSLSTNGNNFQTGVPFTFSIGSGGALPVTSPVLDTTKTYYSILTTNPVDSPALIKIATSYTNAINGVFLDITGAGSPTVSVTVTGQTQIGSINAHPGNIVACRTLHRRLFLFSQNFTEVWENAGIGSNLPFRRNNTLLMEVGTPAIGSISVGFDRMFFLSQDRDGLGAVMEVVGTQAMPISNRALDYQLAQYAFQSISIAYSTVSDARGVLIKENGLIFYRLNFTAANHTFVFGSTMSEDGNPKWHEEQTLNGDRHPAQTHAYYKGVNYYGDYEKPAFYICDNNLATNNGEAIPRIRIGRQAAPPGYNRTRIDRFQLDVIQGQVDNVNNIAPIVYLSISKDGGQSYGYRLSAPMGKIGERTFRTVWRKLGTIPRGQGFLPKIEFFNEIPFVILGASWDFEILPE